MVSLGLLVSTPSMPVIHPNQRDDQLHFVSSLRTIRARMMQKNTLKRKSPNFLNLALSLFIQMTGLVPFLALSETKLRGFAV